MESELLVVQVEAAIELTPRRWRVTDEALMEEASRYYVGPISPSDLGHRGILLFFFILGQRRGYRGFREVVLWSGRGVGSF